MSDDSVQVKFGAQIEGLIAGVNQAKEAIAGIIEPISGVMSAFKGLAEVAGVAFAVDKLAEFENKYAELGEQIERTSKITGISTDQVQEFKLAIQLAGGDAETAAQTLKILEKNIGDAQSGSGKAYEAFTNLGITLNDLKTKSPIDILAQMKTRMDEAGNSAGQAAIKVEYMRAVAGRAGADFLALDGSLDKVKKIAEETGYVMSPQMVNQAKELADSTHTLSAAWTGLSNTIASDIEPAYQRLIDLTTKVVEGTTHLLGGVKQVQESGESAAMLDDDAARGQDLGKGQFGPQQVTNPLPPLAQGDGKEDNSAVKMAQNDAQTQLEIQKVLLEGKKDLLQEEGAANQISKVQELQQLQTVLDQEYQASYDALEKELAIVGLTSEQKNAIRNKELVLTAQYFQQSDKLSAQAAAAQVADLKKTQEEYKAFFGVVDKDLDQMLAGVLQGTTTWQASMAKLFSNLAVSFVENIAKMMLKWAAFEAAQAVFKTGDPLVTALGSQVPTAMGGTDKDSALGAAMTKLGTFLGLNTAAHTAGTAATTGNAVATTSNTVATVTDTAVTGTGTVATTASTLATTVNTTTTASSGLLHVAALAENTIATAANTISTDLLRFVEGVKALLGFDVGTWSVPSTGPALIHQGEIILPPGVSSAVRAGTMQVGNVGGVGASGGGAGGDNYTINLNAIDTQTGANFLQKNMSVIVKGMAQQMRNLNPNLRPT